MKRTVCMVRFVSHGLYEWGKGFISAEKQTLWTEFWDNCPSATWKITKYEEMSVPFLVSMDGSFYLHPMDFDAVLTVPEFLCNDIYLDDLRELIAKCAKYVGFTYDLYVSEKKRIDFDNFKSIK